ncbi:hypothetical protein RND81_10G048900 [Saponaria officinalis]|uniref:Uncharacterized protein n=1 Tax=Saponaria officinalis TaxID=3572 RepID=A0AAW1HZ37_SAPOF
MASTQERRVVALLTNHTGKDLKYERYINWSGTLGPSPPIIPAGGVTRFNDFGPKAAVVYHGQNVDQNPISWVLAWDAPEIIPIATKKVYVTCGSKSVIDNMSDDQILKGLDESNGESMATDALMKITATANIRNLNPWNPVDSIITATFESVKASPDNIKSLTCTTKLNT